MKSIFETANTCLGFLASLFTLYTFRNLDNCPDIEQRLALTLLLLIILIYFTTFAGYLRRKQIGREYGRGHFYDPEVQSGIRWLQILVSLPFAIGTALVTPWNEIFNILNNHFTFEHQPFNPFSPAEIIISRPFENVFFQILFIMAVYGIALLFSMVTAEKIYYALQLERYTN